MFGWKPKPVKNENAPIPLCFGLVEYNLDEVIGQDNLVYLGPRHKTTFKLHERYANK
jgi:hypothetical protein